MPCFKPRYHKGFTLLELLLVLFLLGLLASAGLLFTENQRDEAAFAETQRRISLIRDAIIRSADRAVNGQPELAGFVVDNGRLPYCLKELIASPFELTDSASAGYYASPCDPSKTLLKPVVTDRGIRVGWHGPYIQVNPEQDGVRRFRDGYQNGLDAEDPNFGWWVQTSGVSGNGLPRRFHLASDGYDLDSDADDYPPAGSDDLIVDNDWLAPGSFNIRFVNTSPVSAIENIDNNLKWTVTLAKSSTDPDAYTGSFTLDNPVSSLQPNQFFEQNVSLLPSSPEGFSDRIPVGYYAFEVDCSATPPAKCPVMASTPYIVQLLPDHQVGPFRWNIQP